MKILLPVDGSDYTKRMLAYIGAHEEMFGAGNEFTLIHIQTPIPPRARAAVGREIVEKMHEDETRAATRGVVAYFKQKGWKTKLVTKVGSAGDEIAKLESCHECGGQSTRRSTPSTIADRTWFPSRAWRSIPWICRIRSL